MAASRENMALKRNKPRRPTLRWPIAISQLGASHFSPPLTPLSPISCLLYRRNTLPWIMYIHFFECSITPYMGDASGSQPVPEPLRFIGRFKEKAWLIGGTPYVHVVLCHGPYDACRPFVTVARVYRADVGQRSALPCRYCMMFMLPGVPLHR